jgi:hypothetical protein
MVARQPAQPASAGSVVQVTIGGDVRYDPATGRVVAQNNASHWTRGLSPRCDGAFLRIGIKPTSIVAPWVSLSGDGAMGRRGIHPWVASSSKTRILVNFTRADGQAVTCREAFYDSPDSNLWVVAVVTRRAPGR